MARKGRRERENKRVSSSSFPWSLAPGQQSLAFRALSVDHFVQMDSSPFLARSAKNKGDSSGQSQVNWRICFFRPPLYLAPLHMSPVVKFSMCSYDRAGLLGSRDLGFSNRHRGKRAENFPI